MDELRLIDTFSGIGGFSYAAEKLLGGYKTVAFVECEPYCQKVLKKHWPKVPIYDDIRTYKPEPYSADIICGGFPCQDISQAGRQAGITKETRSGLFFELMRIVRLVRPKFVILENVSAILNNGLGVVLGELAQAGFDCEYACIPASAVGACHQRDRWWLVAYSTGISNESQGQIQSRRDTFIRSSTPNSQSIRMERSGQGRKQVQFEMEKTRLSKWRYQRELLSSEWSSYASEPVLRRGDDGLSNRVHRLKALGNSIVPQVATIPLKRVLDLANAAQDI